MQTGISHAGTVLDTDRTLLAGLSGLSVEHTATGWTVLAVSAGDGGLTRLTLDAGTGALSLIDQIALGQATPHALISQDGAPGALLLSRYDSAMDVDAAGASSAARLPFDGAMEALADLHLPDGTRHVAWSLPGQAGLGVARMSADGQVLSSIWIADDAATPLGDVRALDLGLDAAGRVQIIAGSGRDSGLTVLRQTDTGGFEVAQALTPSGSFAHYQISTLARIDCAAGCFVIAGASASGSLSVFRSEPDGTLTQTDHLFDSRDTRFAGVDQITVEVIEGRILIAAGGADRGVSLFELDTAGALHHLSTVVDDDTLALDDLEGLALVPSTTPGQALLVTGAAREGGISVLTLTLDALQPVDPDIARIADALPAIFEMAELAEDAPAPVLPGEGAVPGAVAPVSGPATSLPVMPEMPLIPTFELPDVAAPVPLTAALYATLYKAQQPVLAQELAEAVLAPVVPGEGQASFGGMSSSAPARAALSHPDPMSGQMFEMPVLPSMPALPDFAAPLSLTAALYAELYEAQKPRSLQEIAETPLVPITPMRAATADQFEFTQTDALPSALPGAHPLLSLFDALPGGDLRELSGIANLLPEPVMMPELDIALPDMLDFL